MARISDPVIARFWTQEFPSYDDRFRAEAAAPILNKAGQFTASPTLRNILGQVSPKFDLAYAMDNRRILVHVDELQSFGTEAFASLLSEARKFATHFCVANQYTEQLSPQVRAAVLGNAGTIMVFRVSAADAELLAPKFHPLPAAELADQSPYRAWMRRSEEEHRVAFIDPPLFPPRDARGRVIATSRRKFGRPRASMPPKLE